MCVKKVFIRKHNFENHNCFFPCNFFSLIISYFQFPFNDVKERQALSFNKIYNESNNLNSLNMVNERETRYQNISSECYGYLGEAVNIKPYGVAK